MRSSRSSRFILATLVISALVAPSLFARPAPSSENARAAAPPAKVYVTFPIFIGGELIPLPIPIGFVSASGHLTMTGEVEENSVPLGMLPIWGHSPPV